MGQIEVNKIDPKRFNALISSSRSPAAAYISQEVAWFANEIETILGVILFDITDNDYVAIVLGRDEGARFRAFDVESEFENQSEAENWIIGAIKKHTKLGKKIYPQGDTRQSIDLFKPIVPDEQQHPYFIHLNGDKAYLPAKSIIQEMMPHFIDIDGNFVEQFQSTGFDSRLWELYLYSYLVEEQLFIDRHHNAPDFLVSKYGTTIGIEAVIVGRKSSNPPTFFKESPLNFDLNKVIAETNNDMPLRFGSPLYKKLNKRYWELPHVKGNPLIIAIADFHDDQSMLWSSTSLINYLYGIRQDSHYDENGKLIITSEEIGVYKKGDVEIPAGFFFITDSENISGILFSASGTLSKFNRMGRQAGFGDPNIRMVRVGTCYDHKTDASVSKMFEYQVDESSEETWAEGLSMFHNPNAIYPVPEELFPSIAHHYFKNGQIISHLPDFSPYASITFNIKPDKD